MEPDLSPTSSQFLRDNLERHWRWIVVAALLALVLGAIAIIVPIVASIAVENLVGWLLVVGAGFVLAHAFHERGFWRIAGRVLLAALWVLAGVWLLVAPLTGTITLTFVLVAWLWVDGGFRVAAAIFDPLLDGAGRLWMAIGGVLSFVLGLLIWVNLPSSAAWAIGLLVGVNLVFQGVHLLSLGLTGRRLAHGERVRFEPRHA